MEEEEEGNVSFGNTEKKSVGIYLELEYKNKIKKLQKLHIVNSINTILFHQNLKLLGQYFITTRHTSNRATQSIDSVDVV